MSKPSNTKSGWAPLSYPSSSIFSSTHGSATFQNIKCERRANPYFPLHHDVLHAALRELLLLDGTIDAETLMISDTVKCVDGQCKNTKSTMGSVDGNIVPPDDGNNRLSLGQFISSEQMVEAMICKAISIDKRCDDVQERAILDDDNYDDDKEISMCESSPMLCSNVSNRDGRNTQSKRKVSDVDEPYKFDHAKRTRLDNSFPPHIIQLVQSNILVLNKTSINSSDKQSNRERASQSLSNEITIHHSYSTDSIVTKIEEFLRSPQMQKHHTHEQQFSSSSSIIIKPMFALPRLLKASINNETQMREIAHTMAFSILDDYTLDSPLRIFLGYKSNKSVDRSKLVSIFADILFDVSHAMYAWVQTEKEMSNTARHAGGQNITSKSQGNRVQIPIASQNVDVESIIKDSLFDERALKQIGGFEPYSLLPLALGVRHCRQYGVSWEEYAQTAEGRSATAMHLQCGGNGNCMKSKKRYHNEALFEIGKQRRGRRGRALRMGKNANASIVG
eukprot:scaffold18445_cov71-Cyclotella_meneghiniana.AAC.7